jgi:hypothetical protein
MSPSRRNPPGPAAEQTLALALLHLAGYHQLVAVQIDIDVLAPHTRKLDLDDIRAVGLDDVGRRQPGAITGEAAEHRLRQPIHLRIEILELAKRAPLRLTSRTTAPDQQNLSRTEPCPLLF